MAGVVSVGMIDDADGVLIGADIWCYLLVGWGVDSGRTGALQLGRQKASIALVKLLQTTALCSVSASLSISTYLARARLSSMMDTTQCGIYMGPASRRIF